MNYINSLLIFYLLEFLKNLLNRLLNLKEIDPVLGIPIDD
jgi:hypothetical protein